MRVTTSPSWEYSSALCKAVASSATKAKAGFRVLDPQQALADILPEVAEQAGTVILLTNIEYRPAIQITRAVPGVDLVIAARPGQLPSKAKEVSDGAFLAITAEQPVRKHTGRRVGRLVVTVESDGTLSHQSWSSVSMVKTIADDPEMGALLAGYGE